jgi:hypothetical protein
MFQRRMKANREQDAPGLNVPLGLFGSNWNQSGSKAFPKSTILNLLAIQVSPFIHPPATTSSRFHSTLKSHYEVSSPKKAIEPHSDQDL